MTDTRRTLTLADLRGAFSGPTQRAALDRAAEQMAARDAAKAGQVVVTIKPSHAATMNSGRTIEVPQGRVVSIEQGLARRSSAIAASSADYDIHPKKDFRAAVEDPRYPAFNPAKLDIPEELLALIKDPTNKRILLVGHKNADHDAVGATLTLKRTLEALGKKVDVCIDDEQLSHTQMRFVEPGEIKQAGELEGNRWDAAIVCDVARCAAIGDANKLLEKCKQVAIIDHHPHDRNDDLERKYRVKASWIDDCTDAASLQVCAIAERLLGDRPIDPAAARRLFAPALAGMCTDTGWGTFSSMNPLTPQIFKHVLQRARVTVTDLERKLAFDVPRALASLIEYKAGLIKREVHGTSRRMMTIAVSRSSWDQMLEAARSTNPTFATCDLMRVVKEHAFGYKNSTGCVALVVQDGNSAMVSARSNGGRARELASAFGRGGQPDAASMTIYGTGSFANAMAELIRKARIARVID